MKICIKCEVGKELSEFYKNKINNLEKGKFITERDSSRLHSIRFLGNDSVHEMDVPNEKKLRMLIVIRYIKI